MRRVPTGLVRIRVGAVTATAFLMGLAVGAPNAQGARGARAPDVYRLVGPVVQRASLRSLPHIISRAPILRHRLTRHPHGPGQVLSLGAQTPASVSNGAASSMPSPSQTFGGMTQSLSGCGCLPPDTVGDVGPNDYIQSVNTSIRIHDKSGNVLAGPITYNAFFSSLGTSTPCGNNQNRGDGTVVYDHMADRWVVSDFAFPAFPGTSFWQCIGVSRTADPVAGGWYLYAVQVDPANPTFLGDYPKLGLWRDGYYLAVNLFSNGTTFNGVRVFALDRASMINGQAAHTIAFTIPPANLGDQYSLLPATFRTGTPPPVGEPEWFMDVNSPAGAGTVENQVFVRRFHADFATPANSTFGVGASHAPDGIITVNGFVDAFTNTGSKIVPNGTSTTSQYLDTLGDKLMYPLVYQNLAGTESIYADQTVNNSGPTAIRWYQFDVTGNTIPATPAQQQSFNNGGDGLYRWMPSLNVDSRGNLAIGYSASSTTVDPGIRYAGRLASDPANGLAQGEAIMTPGTGHQTSTTGRWGDYSSTFVDPSDGCTFYHTNEYYSATSSAGWNTQIGSFKFPSCSITNLTVSKNGSGSGTITSSPPGIDCGPTCSAGFTIGSQVTLTATPASGSVFAGWSGGGCSGTGTCTVTMSADQTVTATFTAQHTLAVSKSGSGSGTVTSSPAGIDCGPTCSAAFGDGTSVSLTANPAAGSTFTGWGGDCSGSGSCQLTMSGDHSVSASFTAMPRPPNTKIRKAKINSKKRAARFKFKATGAKATGFQCALLRKKHKHPKFKKCRSPKIYRHLKKGKYTFEVRAFSAAGKDPTPAKKRFRIK